MKAEEYFGDWMPVIDKPELLKIMNWLQTVDKTKICPEPKNIFRAFQLCSRRECKIVFLGQDPYPQKGVATGILFGNSKDTPEEQLSPSLRVIKEAAIDYTVPHNVIEFDNTLESWAKQGILMINTALTCAINVVGSHFPIWQGFISKLIRNFCEYDSGIVFVLFGSQANIFSKDIIGFQDVIKVYHPAYYARKGERMPSDIFYQINDLMKSKYGEKIEFYRELEYGTC